MQILNRCRACSKARCLGRRRDGNTKHGRRCSEQTSKRKGGPRRTPDSTADPSRSGLLLFPLAVTAAVEPVVQLLALSGHCFMHILISRFLSWPRRQDPEI